MVLLATVLGLAVNRFRTSGQIPLIATKPYQILVPCPEYAAKAQAIAPHPRILAEKGTLLLDAREKPRYAADHLPGARSIPFDYLSPTSPETIQHILLSRAQRVVVYGDGDQPDSGEQLANELVSKGIKNVFFVTGGAPALAAKHLLRGAK
jgi:rhodanese-related sulfurtransferase